MHFQLSMEMVRKVQRPASTALLDWQKLGLMRVQLGGDGYTHLVTVQQRTVQQSTALDGDSTAPDGDSTAPDGDSSVLDGESTAPDGDSTAPDSSSETR